MTEMLHGVGLIRCGQSGIHVVETYGVFVNGQMLDATHQDYCSAERAFYSAMEPKRKTGVKYSRGARVR